MPSFEYLIIGGGIAGVSAAETIRQKDKLGSLGLISGQPHFLYSRVLLPEFIRGEVELEKVMLRSADDYKKNGIEIFLGESVENFDPARMILTTDKGRKLTAKKILISSGGRPKPWNFETLSPENIFRLQTLDDALKIKKFLSGRSAGNALVVGGGFMALEFIEILFKYGWSVKLLVAEKYFWPDYLDDAGFGILSELWAKNGVETITGDEVAEIKKDGHSVSVKTKKGKNLNADFIGVGIGLDRNLKFSPHLAVKPPSGGVEVNEYLETKFPSVWAAGDVAIYPDFFSGRRRSGGNWSGAFMQGRTAGLNMVSEKTIFKTISAYSISHLGQAVALVGDAGPFSDDANIKTSVPVFDKEKREYVKIFKKDGQIAGAVMINGQEFLGATNQAIMNKWDASNVFKKNT